VERLADEAAVAERLEALASAGFNQVRLVAGDERGLFPFPAWRLWVEGAGAAGPEWQGVAAGRQVRNRAALHRFIALARARGLAVSLGLTLKAPGSGEAPGLAAGDREGLRAWLAGQPGLAGLQFLPDTSGASAASLWEPVLLDLARMAHGQCPGIMIEVPVELASAGLLSRTREEGIALRLRVAQRPGWPGLPLTALPTARSVGFPVAPLPRDGSLIWAIAPAGPARALPWDGVEDVRRWISWNTELAGDGWDLREPADWGRRDALTVGDLTLRMWGSGGHGWGAADEFGRREFDRAFGPAGGRLRAAFARAGGVLPRIMAAVHPPTVEGGALASVERHALGRVLADYAARPSGDPERWESLAEAARRILAGGVASKRTPEETIQDLEAAADGVLAELAAAEALVGGLPPPAWRGMVRPLRSVAWLARFHARRMRAAVHYNLFLRGQKLAELVAATFGEKDAVAAWRELVTLADPAPAAAEATPLGAAWRAELRRLEQSLRELEEMCCPPDDAVLREKVWTPTVPERWSVTVEHRRPERAAPGSPLRLAVRVTRAPAGAKVWLHHGPAGGERVTLEMIAGADGEHTAEIPGAALAGHRAWVYQFELRDPSGRIALRPEPAEGLTAHVFPLAGP
jgi:hypothetical protein